VLARVQGSYDHFGVEEDRSQDVHGINRWVGKSVREIGVTLSESEPGGDVLSSGGVRFYEDYVGHVGVAEIDRDEILPEAQTDYGDRE
jgi:hypothetical protein